MRSVFTLTAWHENSQLLEKSIFLRTLKIHDKKVTAFCHLLPFVIVENSGSACHYLLTHWNMSYLKDGKGSDNICWATQINIGKLRKRYIQQELCLILCTSCVTNKLVD